MLNPEALCAVEVAKIIRNPDRVAVQNFAEGEIEVQGVTVSSSSVHVRKKLSDLRLEGDLRIGFIHRQEEVIVPQADTEIAPLDTLTLFGNPEALASEKSRFEGSQKQSAVRIVLASGDETSIALVRLLKNLALRFALLIKTSSCAKN